MFYATLRQKPPGDLPVVCFVGPVDPTPEPGEIFLVTLASWFAFWSSENVKFTMGTEKGHLENWAAEKSRLSSYIEL